jgi:ABC-type cobalamin/Fe3+-siderophores transport system ATPase subunit
MYIHRIILRDVQNFVKEDILFYDELWQKPVTSALLLGPNGAGKTTLLHIIKELWECFGEWLRLGDAIGKYDKLLVNAGLIAIEIRQFEVLLTKQQSIFTPGHIPQSVWLFIAKDRHYRAELDDFIDKVQSVVIGEIMHPDKGGSPQFENWENTLWFKKINEKKEALLLGLSGYDPLPNLVYFDADNRKIFEPEGRMPEPRAESRYKWLFMYKGRRTWDNHIEYILRNMKLRNPDEFYAVLADINQLLFPDKELLDLDDALRLNVRIKSSQHSHPISDLSSGEKQSLIITAMVSRWLMPGGIVLIDEPDLHLHISLQRPFIHTIKTIVESKQGQLIVASHSPEMWDDFREAEKFRLGLQEMAK